MMIIIHCDQKYYVRDHLSVPVALEESRTSKICKAQIMYTDMNVS